MEKSITVSLDPKLAKHGITAIFLLAAGEVSTEAQETCAAEWCNAQADFQAQAGREQTFQKIVEHPHLQGYRDLHASLGFAAGQDSERPLIPSPESLIRILMSEGSLRSLGVVVDLYNIVALKHLVSTGAHDADKLGGSVALAMNTPNIMFMPLGQKKKQPLPFNEYSYSTDNNRAICRLECKQANETKLRADTKRWFFILQGNANISEDKLELARRDLVERLGANINDLRLGTKTLTENSLNGVLSLAERPVT